ncbi:PHD finger domain protein [Cordyceps fumosorosea ARSEF 2679]|uniref:PHD finger domain protein n=1 Tax=Cordyceps fumosorosea (strain ARSEF 2679) TaxID=1081104 RepID=A0A167WQC4_CORFA|nr:PHD finger domain protein [Cordyceps fumosorosea ARSEF 2679]OAA64079.1 PHD finger domain protein [Cordyceps fumosorosea ARSEF 2679]
MDGHSVNAVSPLLQHIRSMWEFANLCQWIYIFGKAAKIDEGLEIEDIETECLKPSSTILSGIALALLKLVSSHRGLTYEVLDEQLRKEYISKLPEENPLGDGETIVRSFRDLDTPTKIVVLQQLTQWVMSQPERLRGKMEEPHDIDQTSWRIEPYGWDAEDRTYYVLDDNRVYRLSEISEQPLQKLRKQKTYGTSRRSGRRRRTSNTSTTKDCALMESMHTQSSEVKSRLGSMTWECVAVTLDEVRHLIDSLQTTRNANEKILRKQLDIHLLPILEKQEASRKRKEAQHQRELLSLAKMANAKRSSRIAGKIEQQKEEEKAREEWVKAQKELESQRRERQMQMKLERERDFRMFSRERRLNERAARRRLHEEELSHLSDGHGSAPNGRTRTSDRQLQSEIDRNKRALKTLEEEEEDWTFDCVCGLYGQVDDGAHSIACEGCNVWQHSSCVGIAESEADRVDFHFVCGTCTRQKEGGAAIRKPVIKLRVNTSNGSMHHEADSRTLGKSNDDESGIESGKRLEAIARGENPKQETGDIDSTLKSGHGPGKTAHVASGGVLPLATKDVLQASPSIDSVRDTSSTVMSTNSAALLTHTTQPTAPQEVCTKGSPVTNSTKSSSDQITLTPVNYTITAAQGNLRHVVRPLTHFESGSPSKLRGEEQKNGFASSALVQPVLVSESELPVLRSEVSETCTDRLGDLTPK